MQQFSVAIRSFLDSFSTENSLFHQWKNGQDISLDILNKAVPFWMIMSTVCLLMFLCGVVFFAKKRIFRGIVAVLSAAVYLLPVVYLFLTDSPEAIDNAAIITMIIAMVWFFISNLIVYPHMNFFLRLLASYIHFMIILFPGLIAEDSSVSAAYATVWFLPLAFHIFLFIMPLLPDTGGNSSNDLISDMLGDEYDDSFVDGI